jgi:hypothetical protein
MKELLVECSSYVLVRKYGPLSPDTSRRLLRFPEAFAFSRTADVRELARSAASAPDLSVDSVFGRILGFLRYAAAQFYEDKSERLSSTSRLRTALLNHDMAADFKKQSRSRKGPPQLSAHRSSRTTQSSQHLQM